MLRRWRSAAGAGVAAAGAVAGACAAGALSCSAAAPAAAASTMANFLRELMLGKITRQMGVTANEPIRTLFICHFNRKRSATAERVFGKDPALEVLSAGTSEDALVQVNQRMLEWADVVFVMDDDQCRELARMFPEHPALAKVIC